MATLINTTLIIVTTQASATTTGTNLITLTSTTGISTGMSVYFIGDNVFGGVSAGTLYWVTSVSGNQITVSTSYGGANVALTTATGTMDVAVGHPAVALPSGTVKLFQQTAAPTGWTKSTTHDNKALRVVNGSVSSGGSVAFTSALTNQSVSGSATAAVSAMTLSSSQMPSHAHWCSAAAIDDYNFTGGGGNSQLHGLVSDAGGYSSSDPNFGAGRFSLGQGGGGSHDHGTINASVSGVTVNLAVSYVDVIIATKN